LTKEKSEGAKTPVVGTRVTKEMGEVDENVKVEWGGKGEKQACLVTSSGLVRRIAEGHPL
jgi:hypothetical protein